MILLSIAISLLYTFLIFALGRGFDRVKVFTLKKEEQKNSFSIVIPFRNEADNLPDLLRSISKLNYPVDLFEILIVNDDSKDTSAEIIKKFSDTSSIQLTLLNNKRKTNSPKKDAITTAIKNAKYDWILTTDADCVLSENWLLNYDAFIQEKNVKFICGPVNYAPSKNFLQRFQHLELLSLMGATIGGFGIKKPFMCNGANLGYTKSFFKTVNGFEGNSNIASGDDIFMLEKALAHDPSAIGYLKSPSAIVLTKPASNFTQMVHQRIRWASKSSHYSNRFGKLSGLIIFLMNALMVSLFFLVIFQVVSFKILFYCYVIKLYCDFWLIWKTIRFFNTEKVLSSYLLSSILYPFISVYIVIKSTFSTYNWKDRRFRK